MSGTFRSLRVTSSLLGAARVLQSYRFLTPSASFYAASDLPTFTSHRVFCATQQTLTDIPSKETLFRVDWLLEHVVPGLFKASVGPFLGICLDNVEFEDKLYNYSFSQKSQLLMHLAKIRLYYHYRSPYNKVEKIGSCIYENEDVVVLLWRLSTVKPSIWTYLPSFITRRETKIITTEGALDIHVNSDGMVYKIVNRKITAADREGAKAMEAMKIESENARKKLETKEIRRVIDQLAEDEKRTRTV